MKTSKLFDKLPMRICKKGIYYYFIITKIHHNLVSVSYWHQADNTCYVVIDDYSLKGALIGMLEELKKEGII